jgi:hypothetical protein
MASMLHTDAGLTLVAGAIPIALAAIAGWSILSGDLQQDDLLLLYRLANYGLGELLLTPHGGHSLLTSNLAYALLYTLFGIDAGYWFPLVLLTHLLNVFLLFRVILGFTRRRWIACGFACAWGSAAVHFGTLSWFAVYGHVLVATCLAWILLDLTRCNASGTAPAGRTLARWLILLLAAATSFGVGIGIAMAAAIALPLLLPSQADRRRTAVVLTILAVLIPALYLGHQLLYTAVSARPVAFGLRETFAQPSSRFLRLPEMGVSVYHLACSGVAGLVPGPLLVANLSGKLLGPLALIPFSDALWRFHFVGSLVLVPVAVLSVSFVARRRAIAGLTVLLVACYGIVAIWWVASGRADTVTLLALNARVDTVPRYHYVGTLILAVILALALEQTTRRWRLARLATIALAVWLAITAPQHVATYRGLSSARERAWHRQVLARIQAEVDAQPDQRVVYLKNRPFRVWGRTYGGIDLPGWAGIYAIAHPQDSESHPLVRFIEPDAELLRAVRNEPGTRMAELLVGPGEKAHTPILSPPHAPLFH